MWTVAIRSLLAVGALGCAAWLAFAHYPIGLDFEGGAMVVVRPHGDAQRVVAEVMAVRPEAKVQVHDDSVSVELANRTDADTAAVTAAIGGNGEVEHSMVVLAAQPTWMGRPLACAAAVVAALAWLAALLLRRAWVPTLVGTFALAAAASVVLLLARGATLSMPVQLAGVLLAMATVPAARPGEGTPLARLVSAWPAGLAIALVAAGSLIVRHPAPGAMWQFAIHFAPQALPAAVVLAALCVLAATGTGVPSNGRGP
jgi:hypothetical protein